MVESIAGSARAPGVSYDDLLDQDTHPVRPILKTSAPLPAGPTRVDTRKYYSKEYHDLEVERLWKRVWQLACHEDEIPNPGDVHVYKIASLSFIIVRTEEGDIKAFPNACLHRGRSLVDEDNCGLEHLRCPFHGWTWKLNGNLKEIPCHWDFPTVTRKDYSLPDVKTGLWGGFVFINPDPDAEPLEDFLGDIDKHFTLVPFERRFKAVHVAKVLPCNWKLAQEAFMESYHVIGTHPTLLTSLGDANSKYDVFGNVSRAITADSVHSPHLEGRDAPGAPITDGMVFTRHRHALTGDIYERQAEGEVKITTPDGKTGIYDQKGLYLSGDTVQADPQLCNWIGGGLIPGMDQVPEPPLPDLTDPERRAAMAAAKREEYRPALGDAVDEFSDAELIDSLYYSVFPNISPWGSFSPIFYRFRPYGDNPEQSIHECMFMLPVPKDAPRPPPAKMHWLGLEDDYLMAPELGPLAKVFNQDHFNLAEVQKGVKNHPKGEVIFGDYQETKLRHFHMTLDDWLARE